ncbi:MAG: hypothetical protein ACOY3D_07320 [Candidatus Omnitrophota bacterium]
MKLSRDGIALTTVVIATILICAIAVAAINFMASQAILIENQVKRIARFYSDGAAIHKNLLRLFLDLGIESPVDMTENPALPIIVTVTQSGSTISATSSY